MAETTSRARWLGYQGQSWDHAWGQLQQEGVAIDCYGERLAEWRQGWAAQLLEEMALRARLAPVEQRFRSGQIDQAQAESEMSRIAEEWLDGFRSSKETRDV